MTRKDILDAAEKIVTGERQQTYGEPEDNFATIAQMWEAYLGIPINAMDVSMMMVLLKVARVSGRPDLTTIDNFIDICGYAACGGEVAHREGRTRDSHKEERDEETYKRLTIPRKDIPDEDYLLREEKKLWMGRWSGGADDK